MCQILRIICHPLTQGDSLLRWSTRTLAQFQASLVQLLSSELTSKERQANLWELLQANVLLSSLQLGKKYEKVVAIKTEEISGEVEDGGSLQERKVAE